MRSTAAQLVLTLAAVATVAGLLASRGLPPSMTLWRAAWQGDAAETRRSLRWGTGDVAARDKVGAGPHTPPIMIIDGQIQKPRRGPYWWKQRTPLHVATRRGDVETIRLLLDAGAEVDARTEEGVTPLHMAASTGSTSAAELLIAVGAEINARDEDGRTPLHEACLSASVAAIRVKPGGGTQQLDDALTPYEAMAKMLLDHGARINARTSSSCGSSTPLDQLGHKECRLRQLLLEHGGKEW